MLPGLSEVVYRLPKTELITSKPSRNKFKKKKRIEGVALETTGRHETDKGERGGELREERDYRIK